MADVNAQIKIAIDAAQAQAEIKALQSQITALNASMASQRKAKGFDLGMGNVQGQIVQIQSATSALNRDLQKMSRGFGSSFGTLKNSIKGVGPEMALARQNAAALGTQYVMLGKQANGAMAAFKGGQLAGFNMELATMQQRVAIGIQGLNQMGTAALNWGKNIQWAGRQLMVGLTIPFTIFAGVAIKSFQDVEREIINLKKVYGDFGTSDEEVQRVTAAVKELAREMSVLGFSAQETIGLAADAAALGFAGDQLLEVTKQASEFASLGMMTQTEALNSLVAVNSAFRTEVDDLGQSVDFLNAVENQTILSMQDMAEAIPITAAAIQGLGGDIKDLAVFMTAMREGGIGANESANALKTSLARLITPTRQALETATDFGIALESIVANNEGDLMGMVQSLAGAMESLSDLQQQQLLSDLFGKRQFARMGALFNNLNREGSQAQKTIELTTMSMEDLAQVRDKELGSLKESPAMQLTKQLENIQLALAPIGEIFAELLVKVLGPLETVLNWFNGLSDGFKQFVAIGGAVVSVLIPAITMFVGLMGNLAGTMMNVIATLARWATGTQTFTTEQAEMAAQANATAVAENGLTNSLQQQAIALESLIAQYNRLNTARMPGGGTAPPLRMATGGKVPGSGNTDKIPALLTPGEYVINKKQSQKHSGFLTALNNGSVRGFVDGYTPAFTNDEKVKAMAITGRRSGFSEQDINRIFTEAGKAAGHAAGTELSNVTKAELQSYFKQHGYAGTQGKGPFTSGTDRKSLERGHQAAGIKGPAEEFIDDLPDHSGGTDLGNRGKRLRRHLELAQNLPESHKRGVKISSIERLPNMAPFVGMGVNQGHKSGGLLNADVLHTDWVQDPDKTKAAFRDQATTMYNQGAFGQGEEAARKYAQTIQAIEESYRTVEQQLAKAKADTSAGAGGKLFSEDQYGEMVQGALRDAGGGDFVDQLTAPGHTMRSEIEISDEIQDDISTLDSKYKELAQAVENKENLAEAELQQRTAELEADIAKFEADKGIWRDGEVTMVGASRVGGPDGETLRIRKGKKKLLDSQGREITEATRSQDNFEGPGKPYGDVSTDFAGIAAEADATMQSIVQSMFTPEQIAQLQAKAREAGVSVSEVYAKAVLEGHDEAMNAGYQLGDSTVEGLKTATETNSPSRATERVGDGMSEGLAQGVRNNADAPVVAAKQVGEQMTLAFDESFDGNAAGRDAMQETEQGMRSGGTGTVPPNKRRMQGSQMAQMGIGMGVSALSTLPMMTGQDSIMGVSSEFAMTVGMATGQVAAFSSMLGAAGPVVAGLAAAAGLAAFGLEVLKKRTEETATQAYELGKNLGGASDAAEKMSGVFGKATAIQKRSQLSFSENEQETADEFAAALGSEGGKKLVEELSGEFGDARVEKTAQYIESAIVNGMIEADQAGTFAKSLANEIGDKGLAGRVNERLMKTQQEGYTRTSGARSIAEKRDRAIKEDGTVGTQGVKGFAATLGASIEGLRAWSTTAAVAEDEYANGIISYREYIDTLNDATKAQAEYAATLRDIPNLSPDTPYINEKNIGQALKDMGVSDEQVASAFDSINLSAEQNTGMGAGKIGNFVSENVLSPAIESAIEENSWLGKQLENTNKRQAEVAGSAAFGGLPGIGNAGQWIAGEAFDAMQLEKEAIDGKVAFAQLYAMTGKYEESLGVAKALQDETSLAHKTYNDVLGRTENETAALQATLAVLNNQGSGSQLNSTKYRDAFAKGFDNEEMNPESYAKLFSVDQTAAQAQKQLAYASGSFSYQEQTGPGGERTEVRVAGGNLSGKQKAEYANAMGSIAEIVGPEMQDKLTEYVAAGIRSGSEDGGTEGIAELNEIFGGDQEVVNAYIEVDLEDGKLDEATEIAEQLKYINTEIPPDMQILFGIDITDPESFAKLSDPTTVDTLSQIGKAIKELPEEEKELAAEFAMSQVNNGKPISLKSFRKDFKEIKKLTEDMEGKDVEQKRQMLIDVITKVNGGTVDPAEVASVYDDLIDTYGAGIIANLPPTTLTKVVNMQVDASQMKEKAREMLALALLADDQAAIDEAKDLIEKANALNDSANDIVAENGLNNYGGSGGGGGGGGGGGDEGNWYKDVFETAEKNNKALKNRRKIIEQNNAIVKESSKLNQEIIDALAADDEAFDDYQKDVKKYGVEKANKRLKKNYFRNIKAETRQQTKDMETQKRREDEVRDSDLDYFTQEQLIADAGLLEMYTEGNAKQAKWAADEAKRRAEAETTTLDRIERQLDIQRQQNDLYQQGIELAIQRAEYEKENEFFNDLGGTITIADGTEVAVDRASLDQRQAEISAELQRLEYEKIKPITDQIDAQKKLIKEKEREYQINEDNIRIKKKELEKEQRRVEALQRALELRQREGSLLSHDLQLMDWMTEDINEAYDERIKALDETARLNERIAQSQQDQLGLADALSKGDIGAAAQAAQQMQQNQMQANMDQARYQMEQAKDNAIDTLTGPESGMTREQIEERQRQLQEDEYYTNLQIRDIEDEIYRINRDIRNEQDIINGYKDSIYENNKKIRDLEWDLFQAQEQFLVPLQKEKDANALILAQADEHVVKTAGAAKIALANFNRERKMWEAEQDYLVARARFEEEHGKILKNNLKILNKSIKAANQYHKGLATGEGNTIAMPKLESIDLSFGNYKIAGVDSSELLSAINDYQIGTITTAKFDVPTTGITAGATGGIMNSVTNNNYNSTNNVTINAAQQPVNADMVTRALKFASESQVG